MRKIGAFAILALLLVPSASRADATLVANGNATASYTPAGRPALTCTAPMALAFALTQGKAVLSETWAPGTSNLECATALGIGAWTTATSGLPRHCATSPLGGSASVGGSNYAISGAGTTASPIVLRRTATSCGGVSILERFTISFTATRVIYKHEYFENNVLRMVVNAGLDRRV